MRGDDANEIRRLKAENARLRDQLTVFGGFLESDLGKQRGQSSAAALKTILDVIPDGSFVSRAEDSEIIYVNEGLAEILGYSVEELIGRKATDLLIWVNPGDRHRFISDISQRGMVDDFVTQFQTKDGDQLTVLAHATQFFEDDKNYLFGIIKNVDQWSSLAKHLNNTRVRYANLVELLPAVLFECDEELGITFINASGINEIGSTTNEGHPLVLTDFAKPIVDIEMAAWIREATERSMQTRIEVEVRRKTGTSYRALLTMSPFPPDSEKRGYLGVLVDLTDQKVVQEKLSKLSRAVEQSPSLVLISDKAGHIEYVNRSFTTLTGYSFEEVLGRTPRILKSDTVPEETYRAMWATILSGKEWRADILNRKKNGETYWQRSVISPLFDDRGELSHFLEVAEDITREKELESELVQSQKMEAIGHLAGGIAHDFNNMLTVMMGVGEMLHERLHDTEDLRGYVDSILSAARKSASLTHQLLAFSRKQLLHPELIDINLIIKDAEKLLRRIVGDNIRIQTNLQDSIGATLLDQSQMHQIILNLVVNSRDAIEGSGTITLGTERIEVDRELVLASGKLRPGNYAKLSIADTGSGMDEETVTHVFEPFYTTKANGTGLGLSTVYGIVQQSNGQIDLQSHLNEGTVFALYFPIVSDTAHANKNDSTKSTDQKGSETIFVVEDESAVRSFVYEVLSACGYTILLAESAEDAMGQWPQIAAKVDLLLTDVVLPQQDGVHMYRALRESKTELPVLFMSGYTDDSANILREIADGHLFLPKPFGAEQLTTFVRKALDSVLPAGT